MSVVRAIWEKTLCHHLWSEFRVRWLFKFVLPRIREISLEGLRLDVSEMSCNARNRLMNCGYEAQELRMCREYLTPDDSVLEIGGAIGFIGLFCQKKLGIHNYVIVEANPRTVEILKRNYRLNGLEPVVWNLALAPEAGTVELEIDGDFWENSIVRREGSSGRKTLAVPSAPLEALFKLARRPVTALILDVEGAEQYLDFAELPAEVDKLIIELHPALIGQERMYNLIAEVIALGFKVAREEGGTFAFLRRENCRQSDTELGETEETGRATKSRAGLSSPILRSLSLI